jgi:peptidoglycan hydrolase CwlO-like protein
MTISKALKVKNRLAQRINNNRKIILHQNSVDSINFKTEDDKQNHTSKIKDLFDSNYKLRKEIIKIKAGIRAANAGIASQLSEIEELKSEIAFYNSFGNIQDGDIRVDSYDSNYIKTMIAYVNNDSKEEIILDLQERIEKLQDEIDEYNAKTHIEI